MTRTMLITGASRGLGRALAETALEAGHRVAATARTVSGLDDLVQRHPGRAMCIPLDVVDALACRRAIEQCHDQLGTPDVVVANAGYATLGSIEDSRIEDMRAVVETNLWGVVNIVKAALPAMRDRGSGRFVGISSVSGRLAPVTGLGSYVTAKFAVEGFLEALALEIVPFGLEVTIVEPGAIATAMNSSISINGPSAPYTDMIAAMASWYAPGDDTPGLPVATAARFVLGAATRSQPPLRLPLGDDAFTYIKGAARRHLDDLDRYETLSRSARA